MKSELERAITTVDFLVTHRKGLFDEPALTPRDLDMIAVVLRELKRLQEAEEKMAEFFRQLFRPGQKGVSA